MTNRSRRQTKKNGISFGGARGLQRVPRLAWALCLLTALPLGACKKPTPATPAPQEAAMPPVEILKDGRWLFTYVEPTGAFATTDKPVSIPEGSRKLVRVMDPSQGQSEKHAGTQVYAIDLNELLSIGKVRARVLSRDAFETAALAQLPAGESSLLAARPASPEGGGLPGATGAAAAGADAGAGGGTTRAGSASAVVVTVYGTSWCGACRAARQYLSARKIPFADKDVERDPAAARELAEKAAKLGVPSDRVPMLEVRGRLLTGFDQARLEALLGEAT